MSRNLQRPKCANDIFRSQHRCTIVIGGRLLFRPLASNGYYKDRQLARTYSTASKDAGPRLKVRQIMDNLDATKHRFPQDDVVSKWLTDREILVDDLTRWQKIDACKTADEAIAYFKKDTSPYIVLKILRKPPQTRKTFFNLLCIHRYARPGMDPASHFYAMSLLLRSALYLQPELLRLCHVDIEALPKVLKSNHFNYLLRILAEARKSSDEIDALKSVIVSEMSKRDLSINRKGYRALLEGSADDPGKLIEIEYAMISAGYSLNRRDRNTISSRQSLHAPRCRPDYDALKKRISSAKSVKQCLDMVQDSYGNLGTSTQWISILKNYKSSTEAMQYCLDLARAQRIVLSPRLTLSLLQACKGRGKRDELDVIIQLAIVHKVKMNAAIWAEYLKKLIWTGNRAEVVDILVNEPGGNHLLDMDPTIRRNPKVWVAAMMALHGLARGKQLEPQKHARSMSLLLSSMQSLSVRVDQLLIWCVVEGAIYSGPRDWGRVHTCDAVVKYFEEEIDLGDEPWKLPCNERLWTSYMTVLMLNEETVLLQQAMTNMLKFMLPQKSLLNLFALGLWESGSIDTIMHWKDYFEKELKMDWPTQEAAFSVRNARRLEYFYA